MKNEGLFWGIGFLIASLLILGNATGLVDLGDVGIISLVLTIFLVIVIVNSIRSLNFAGILFPVAILCIIYDEVLHLEAITPWPVLGAALLASIGLEMIFKNTKRNMYSGSKGGRSHVNAFGDEQSESFDNIVYCNVKFGSSAKYISSDAFERAEISCDFGDAKIYFDNAILKSNHAEVVVNVSFGDVQLFIPRTWSIDKQVRVAFGDCKERGRQEYSSDSPVITIRGSVSMGELDIIYV